MLSSLPVTVLYQTAKKAFNTGFEIFAVLLNRIEVIQQPDKIKYHYDDEINTDGIIIHAIYDDDTEEDITDDCTIYPPDGSKYNGEFEFEIKYKGYTTQIRVTPVTVERLIIERQPNKRSYKSNEKINYRGIKVICVYSDGSQADVTDKCVFEPPNGEELGDSVPQVSYSEGSYSATAYPKTEIKRLTNVSLDFKRVDEIEPKPTRAGEEIDYSNVRVIAEYDDGSTEDVTEEIEQGTEDGCRYYTVDENGTKTSQPKGSKLKNPRQKLYASYSDGIQEFNIPLNEPILDVIEPVSSFIAPKTEILEEPEEEWQAYPMFKVGYTQMGPIHNRTFRQGKLIPYFITYGTGCDPVYTEDAYGNKIGKWIIYDVIPDTGFNVWFINPLTGKRLDMGVTTIPFKYEAKLKTVPEEPKWDGFTVWGYDYDFGLGKYTDRIQITARGPVLYDPAPVQHPTAVKLRIENGKILWDVTVSSDPPYQGEDEYDTVEVMDLPQEIADWLRLSESPSRLVECTDDKVVYEYISGGQTYRKEIDKSIFIIPPTYDKYEGCYTYAQLSSRVRNSQTIETPTGLLHVLAFSSNDDPDNYYYVTFKTSYHNPPVETVALKSASLTNDTRYDVNDAIDYRDFKLTANYTDGGTSSTGSVEYTAVDTNGNTQKLSIDDDGKFTKEDGERLLADQLRKLQATFTNSAGETTSTECEIKTRTLKALHVTPPTKTSYNLFDRIDYSGFKVEVEDMEGNRQEVEAEISSEKWDFVTLAMDDTIEVKYQKGNEVLVTTFKLDLNLGGNFVVYRGVNKNLYRIGDKISYEGLEFGVLVSDGMMSSPKFLIPKEDCTFSVPEGTEITETTDEHITATYKKWGKTYTATFEIIIVEKDPSKRIDRLELVSPPRKTDYIKGENISIYGLWVDCIYKDGHKVDVTKYLKYNVKDFAVNANTPEKIICTYSEEYSGEFSVSFDINVRIFDRLELVPPNRIEYKLGEKLRFDSVKGKCYYANNTWTSVYGKLTFSPPNGSIVTKDTPGSVTATYTEGLYRISSSFNIEVENA